MYASFTSCSFPGQRVCTPRHGGCCLSHRLRPALRHTLVALTRIQPQVSKNPLQWHVTYEAVDAAGNFAVPKVRTVEIQVGGMGMIYWFWGVLRHGQRKSSRGMFRVIG